MIFFHLKIDIENIGKHLINLDLAVEYFDVDCDRVDWFLTFPTLGTPIPTDISLSTFVCTTCEGGARWKIKHYCYKDQKQNLKPKHGLCEMGRQATLYTP